MLFTLASSFMTATRMDAVGHASAPAAPARRSVAARAMRALKRLAG